MRYFREGVVFEENEVRKAVHPSAPPPKFTPVDVVAFGFIPVTETTRPEPSDVQIREDKGVQLINGIPTQVWELKDRFDTQGELDTYLAGVASADAKIKLFELDQKSIRSIREYILTKDDAPDYLKNYESDAVIERAKVV